MPNFGYFCCVSYRDENSVDEKNIANSRHVAVGTGSASAETGFLGLEVQGFDKKVAKILGQIDQNGVLVKNVAIGEAGAIAGFRRGDLIIEFNRQKISNWG